MDVMVVLLLFYSLGIYAGIRFVQANLSKGFQKPALLWEDRTQAWTGESSE